MPDLQQFSVVRTTPQTINNAPRWTISFQICDSATGEVLRDFTGANAFTFPQVLGAMTQADQDAFVQEVVMALIKRRAPDLFT